MMMVMSRFLLLIVAIAVCNSVNASSERCDSHWTKSGDSCYLVIGDSRSGNKIDWDQAKSECESLGSQLADLTSSQTAKFAQELTNNQHQQFWLQNSSTKQCILTATATTEAATAVTDCKQKHSALCVKPVTNCALGWYEFNNRCFSLKAESLSWDEAKSMCNQMGADLLQVKDNATQRFINRYLPSFIKQKITHIWIGLYQTQIGSEHPLLWTSGGDAKDFHQNWFTDQPQLNSQTRNAARIITGDQNGRWEIGRPTESRGYVCEIPAGVDPIQPTMDYKYSCPETWSLYRKSCYKFFSDARSWESSKQQCESLSTTMIDIRDDSEQEFVQRHLSTSNLWIGLRSRDKWNEWYWNDDTEQATYFNWADGEPNNMNNDEYCVQIWRSADGRWNDENCRVNAAYGCKRPANINGSPPPTTQSLTTTSSPICGDGWVKDPFTDYCYKIVQEPMNWPNARLFCQASGGDLASITSINEKTLITGQIQQLTQSGSSVLGYWIGFNDLSEKNRWLWSDGSAVAFLNWDYGEPNDVNGNEDCAQIYPKSLFWNDIACSNQYGFVCKKLGNVAQTPKPEPTTIAVPPGGIRGCRPGYNSYNNMCYRHYSEKVTWDKARQACRNDGGDLVSYEDKFEHEFVSEMVRNQGGYRFWIGLHDTTAAIRTMFFKWSDGSPVKFTKWNVGEPNDYSNEENCVEQYDASLSDQWNDVECNQLHAYVCKRREELVEQTAPTTAPERCPPDYQEVYSGYCYKFVVGTENVTWTQARQRCRSSQTYAQLVAITDSNIQGLINLKLFELKAKGGFWTALYRTSARNFFWSGCCYLSSSSYTNWESGVNMALTYGYVNPSGRSLGMWNLKTSSDTLSNYICRVRQTGVTTTPAPPSTYDPRNCANGWVEVGDRCYKEIYQIYNSRRKDWEEARYECKLLGGDLASIHSSNATALLKDALRSTSVPYWIGLNSRADPNSYVWSDGASPNYFNWKTNQPNNFNKRLNCVQLDSRDMMWSVTSCSVANNYICETPKGINPGNVTTPQPTTTAPGWDGCPSYWYRFKDSCYRSYTTYLDWYSCRNYCRRYNADMVSISDQEEQDFVLRLLNRVSKTRSMWIGLNELGQNGGYKWADGTPVTYTNWNNGEPNNAGGAEHCVTMSAAHGLWNDDQCGTRTGVICKYNNNTVNSTLAPQTPMSGECPKGYHTAGDKCFKLFYSESDKVTWDEAFNRCSQLIGVNRTYLASVSNDYEQAQLISLSREAKVDLWIGLHTRSSGIRRFVWIDNSQVSYTNWARGQPSGGYNRPFNCVTMVADKYRAGQWSDELCNSTRGYVCMTYKQAQIRTTWPGPQPTRQLCQQQGWLQYGSACYRFYSTPATWQAANQACAAAGAQLASVHDVYEQNYLHSLTNGRQVASTWIGLNDRNRTGIFSWSDGWPVTYTYWDRNNPSDKLDRRCVSLGRNGLWSNLGCNSEFPYLCRQSFGQAPSTQPIVNGECPNEEFVKFRQHCYYVSDVTRITYRKNFADAQLQCRLWGGDLTSINDQAEKDFIVNEVRRRNEGYRYGRNYWLGMTKQSLGGFQWLDRSPVSFVYWADGEPSDADGSKNENCVEMYVNDYKWNDVVCSTLNGYICKVQVAPYTASTQSTQSSRATTTTITSTSSSSITDRMSSSSSLPMTTGSQVGGRESGGGASLIIGIVAAVVVVLLVVIVVVVFVVRARNQKKQQQQGPVGFSNANWSRNSGGVKLQNDYDGDDDDDAAVAAAAGNAAKNEDDGFENPSFA